MVSLDNAPQINKNKIKQKRKFRGTNNDFIRAL